MVQIARRHLQYEGHEQPSLSELTGCVQGYRIRQMKSSKRSTMADCCCLSRIYRLQKCYENEKFYRPGGSAQSMTQERARNETGEHKLDKIVACL